MNKTAICPHCSGDKQVSLAHYEHDAITLVKTVYALEIILHPLPENEKVMEVWCSNCGTLFHDQSV